MRIFFVIALVFPLISCHLNTKSEIDEYLQPYFNGLNARNYKPEGLYYSQSFERKLGSEEWKKSIENIWQQFGSIEKMKLLPMSVIKSIAGRSSGTKYIVSYIVERENGFTHETIEIFESNRSKGILEITGHTIIAAVSF